MRARFRSWWKKTSKKRKIVQIFGLVVVVGMIVSSIGGYFFNWTWTGFGPYTPPTSNFQREKTLYDWLQLAIIPVALAFGVLWFNRLQQQRDQQLANQRAQTEREAAEKQAQTERDIALDNQREAALQAYIDKMSELLLEKDLRGSQPEDEVRKIARVRTLTVLPRLDAYRKRSVIQFLYESGLIEKDKRIVGLSGADLCEADLTGVVLRRTNLSGTYLYKTDLVGATLSEANLVDAYLSEANLVGAKLDGADLSCADLSEANLSYADLSEADLVGANLRKADLSEADLSEADLNVVYLEDATNITTEQLAKAKSFSGIMPDGTIHA